MPRSRSDHESTRRRVLIDAARACFLQFGYAKTSLDDIAKRAKISRPLIYRTFKNKEDIFAAVFEDTFHERYPAVEELLEQRLGKKQKLLRACEILVIDVWDALTGSPMVAEYYQACEQLLPEAEAKHWRRVLGYTEAVLGDRVLSETFMLAVDGLMADQPTTATLRRRVEILADRFTRGAS